MDHAAPSLRHSSEPFGEKRPVLVQARRCGFRCSGIVSFETGDVVEIATHTHTDIFLLEVALSLHSGPVTVTVGVNISSSRREDLKLPRQIFRQGSIHLKSMPFMLMVTLYEAR